MVRYCTSQGKIDYAAVRNKPRHVMIQYNEISFLTHVKSK